jgi:hypothetical protein
MISNIDTSHAQVLVSRMYEDKTFHGSEQTVVSWVVTGVSDHNTSPILDVSIRMHTANPELHNLVSYT